jgi:glycosyltransferase involved in cell wall biosynthesis
MDVREAIWSGRWLLRELQARDTLHLHWPSFLYYRPNSRWKSAIGLCRLVVVCLLLRQRGVHIVWTAHNLYPHDGGRREWMHRFSRWFVVRIVDRIFVHGTTAAHIVRAEFGVDPALLQIIPLGNWIGKYANSVTRGEARQRLGVPESVHLFLFIGLCKPYKGLEALIEATANLDAGAFLIVAGKFPSAAYQATLSAVAERLGTDKVMLRPGFIEDADLQVFLNAADTVVLPYREVLTSGAAMLAMSFGRPVVAPRLGALIDLVNEDCGILYDSADPAGLLGALNAARSKHFNKDRILATAAASTFEDAARALAEAHSGCAVNAATAGMATLVRR